MSIIPIKNIYYLLCYAWDILDFKEVTNASIDDYDDPSNLLCWIFVNQSNKQLRRGLYKEYKVHSEEIAGIRGKIEFADSLRSNSFNKAKAICSFDDFTVDNELNRILKATAFRLLRNKGVTKELRGDLNNIYSKLDNVTLIELGSSVFSKVSLNRNNLSYKFLINVCQLIYSNTVLDEQSGRVQFVDFLRDEGKMPILFEAFIRNFYKQHLIDCQVSSQIINWHAQSLGGNLSLLPQMRTDTSIISSSKKIILDTKFYKSALNERFGELKFKSNHLYQLHAYLTTTAFGNIDSISTSAEGILLYPTVNGAFRERYNINGHNIMLATINLDQDWRKVHEELLELVN